MPSLHIYKQNKIENKGEAYDLKIYNKLGKTMEYTVTAFGEHKGENRGIFYGKMLEKKFDSKDSEGNREDALKYEEYLTNNG
ncbi:hypothetical protein ACJDU8_07360 [Clostridium sp. WILCCON 0269]|uniref:Uncharacterized protein n=1 Tax=Candidatus Clostridium eludens TaxID=3381663 RepID=A0ABW8SJG0_9CLOT